jgi:hypothetical protein
METEDNESEQNILTRAVARTMARAKDIVNKSMKSKPSTIMKTIDNRMVTTVTKQTAPPTPKTQEQTGPLHPHLLP